jgi:hypothetical protein
MDKELPAVRVVGIAEFGHRYGQLWHELESGGVIRLVSTRPGLHRAWIDPEPPPGSEPEPVGVCAFAHHLGRYLDDIRGGAVYAIHDGVRHVTRGFAYWSTPDSLASLGWSAVIPYTVRTRTGRVVQRDMFPLAVTAEPPPSRRRGVLAHA